MPCDLKKTPSCGIATALILKIIAFCKKYNLDERSIMICAKFGTIVMANNDLARGVRDLWITLYTIQIFIGYNDNAIPSLA